MEKVDKLFNGIEVTMKASRTGLESFRKPTLEDYADVRKLMFEQGFKTEENQAFLTGSVRFGCATKDSDLDIAFPINLRDLALEWAKQQGGTEASKYNLGVKVQVGAITVNLVFLHPVDYVAWFKAAQMLEASSIFKRGGLPRPLRHGIHEALCASAKMATPELLNISNYKDFL